MGCSRYTGIHKKVSYYTAIIFIKGPLRHKTNGLIYINGKGRSSGYACHTGRYPGVYGCIHRSGPEFGGDDEGAPLIIHSIIGEIGTVLYFTRTNDPSYRYLVILKQIIDHPIRLKALTD